jgi:probable F420-dependent oxidoreductase
VKVGVLVALGHDAGRPEFLEELGPACEQRGFESLWVPEHVVLFDSYRSRYPYTPDGSVPIPADLGLLDPFVALTYVAARTSTLRLGTGICLVGQRNPVYTAKQVADLDVLSRGRVEFGIGLGWLREEYEVLDMPWEKRGARTDDHLRVLKTLWTDAVSRHDGEYYRLPECRMYPKPVQSPHPPVHVGGESDAALRRAVRHGQGWFGMGHAAADLPKALDRVRRALDEHDRDPATFTVTISPPPTEVGPGVVERYAEHGVDRLILAAIAGNRDDLLPTLDTLHEHAGS